jgi:hypothetical protein
MDKDNEVHSMAMPFPIEEAEFSQITATTVSSQQMLQLRLRSFGSMTNSPDGKPKSIRFITLSSFSSTYNDTEFNTTKYSPKYVVREHRLPNK